MDMCLTARMMNADEAERRTGLRVVPADKLPTKPWMPRRRSQPLAAGGDDGQESVNRAFEIFVAGRPVSNAASSTPPLRWKTRRKAWLLAEKRKPHFKHR